MSRVSDSTATVERREREQASRQLDAYLEATSLPYGTCHCGEDLHPGVACDDIPVSVHAPRQYGEAS